MRPPVCFSAAAGFSKLKSERIPKSYQRIYFPRPLVACYGRGYRKVPIIALPMTGGGDVLFPGGSSVFEVSDESARRASEAADSEFGFIAVDAWNVPSATGTLAIAEEFTSNASSESALLVCTGVERFYATSISEDRTHAEITIFHDSPMEDDVMPSIEALEKRLVQAGTELVRLGRKIGGKHDSNRHAQLLRRIIFFSEGKTSYELPESWFMEKSRPIQREIISFDLVELSGEDTFMAKRSLLEGVNFPERLELAFSRLDPLIREMGAKAAIASAFEDDVS